MILPNNFYTQFHLYLSSVWETSVFKYQVYVLLSVTQLIRVVMAVLPRQPVLAASAQFSLTHSSMPKEDTSLHPDPG